MPTLFENITGVSISIQINADQKNIAHANVLAGAVWHVDLEEGKEVTIQITPPSPAKMFGLNAFVGDKAFTILRRPAEDDCATAGLVGYGRGRVAAKHIHSPALSQQRWRFRECCGCRVWGSFDQRGIELQAWNRVPLNSTIPAAKNTFANWKRPRSVPDEIKKNYFLLYRGSVVCRKADSTMTLAGAEGTGPDDVFGISLEPVIDPSSGGAVASVARSAVYDATQLRVDPSATLRDFADRLRERGIFLEKLELVGSVGNGGGPTGSSWDSGASMWDSGASTWDK
jgi:hypothetical protein